MSSSSSDSDSDDFEPVTKIKINIRPKEEAIRKVAADVSEIKASVEAWRPLGPPPHPSLSRRQSSLSSVSSMSFGASSVYGSSSTTAGIGGANIHHSNNQASTATIHSSPSCSSLVNEFSNRLSFSNFMNTTSRTSSPLTIANHNDAIPIAIAIQESIELIVRGHYDPNATEPKYNSRFLGNIKVAFPNAFVRGNYTKPNAALKLRMHSTDNIIRYYASRLIKDLDLGTNSVAESIFDDAFSSTNGRNNKTSMGNGESKSLTKQLDPFNFETHQLSSTTVPSSNSRIIEFDMDALMTNLKKLHDQSPSSKYYNVDVLRYQIAPVKSIEECPLQVCAYWKIEADMVKLRIDFKHSNRSGLNLERLREITFTVNFADFVPFGIDINSLSPDSLSSVKLNNNNNNSGAMNMNFGSNSSSQSSSVGRTWSLMDDDFGQLMGGLLDKSKESPTNILSKIPPQKSIPATAARSNSPSAAISKQFDLYKMPLEQLANHSLMGPHSSQASGSSSNATSNVYNSSSINNHINDNSQQKPSFSDNLMPPYITYEPQAHWNNSIKQLTWKFDTLLSYHKTDGLGSLFAKLDFRNYQGMPSQYLQNCKPAPVDVKFLVIDSTFSKISLSVDSIGYKMSLLKKEIRSGRYRSEPYIL